MTGNRLCPADQERGQKGGIGKESNLSGRGKLARSESAIKSQSSRPKSQRPGGLFLHSPHTEFSHNQQAASHRHTPRQIKGGGTTERQKNPARTPEITDRLKFLRSTSEEQKANCRSGPTLKIQAGVRKNNRRARGKTFLLLVPGVGDPPKPPQGPGPAVERHRILPPNP